MVSAMEVSGERGPTAAGGSLLIINGPLLIHRSIVLINHRHELSLDEEVRTTYRSVVVVWFGTMICVIRFDL